MNWLKNLQKNKSARRSFLTLLIGFILIQVAVVYSYVGYASRTAPAYTARALQQELVRTIKLLDVMPARVLQKRINILAGRAIHSIQLTDGPVKNLPVIQDTTPKILRQFASDNYSDFEASYQLRNGQWVALYAAPIQSSLSLLAGFIVSEVLLLIILVALCVWVVRRLAMPVWEFEHATKRFGVDLQAPPIAMQGAPEMQSVIAAFNEMQGRVRRLVMDRTQMLAAISHDLRTPITRLQLRIEALKGMPQYEAAEADLKEMERMISSILSFARDYVRTEQMERFDLMALLDNICNALVDIGMPVELEQDAPRLAYFGRMIALKRAFSNLIENAVKYGDSADVTIESDDTALKIKICDQGPGIPDDEMEKVFSPFYRIDPARSPEKSGSGLGMAVARDIIRAHGGDITLHNREKGGLLVLVTLPVQGGLQFRYKS